MANPTFTIPKPINMRSPAGNSREPIGVLLFAGILFFLLSLAAFGGVYFYKQLISNQISDINASLEKIKKDFNPELIGQLSQTSEAIESAKSLLASHRSPSRIFELIEKNTLPSVAFSSFSFASVSSSVMLNGEAKSFAALAEQLDVFEKDSLIKGVLLASPSLLQTGNVGFSIKVDLDPSILVYR